MYRLLVAAGLSALFLWPTAIRAQSDANEVPPALDEQMDALVAAAEALRELPTLTPVERAFPTRSETIDYLTSLFHADLPPLEAARLEAFYQSLDLLPDDVRLADAYLTLLGAQVGGFYDTDTRVMNVIPMLGDSPGDSLSITEQIIFVHEYVHALQDQHFGLEALDDPALADNPDRALALTALIEGDATAAMQLFTQEVMRRNPLAAIGLLAEGVLSGTLTLPPGTPEVLARELLFPYEDGFEFVLAVARDSGWDAVNAAYANPPATTEQILHPNKFLAGEGAVQRAEWAADHAFDANGWTRLWNVALGEYYLREHLRTLLAPAAATDAAAGWGGDLFTLYESADGVRLSLLTVAWDTPADADQFVTTYRASLQEAYGAPLADDNRCFARVTDVVCVFALASGDSRLIHAPALADAAAFLPE